MIETSILAAVAVLIVLMNAFFVLAEFSLIKVRAQRLQALAKQGHRGAKRTLDVVRRLDTYLSATQLGITIASLSLGWVGEPAFTGILERLASLPGWWRPGVAHALSAALAFTLITALHIVLGELAPKYLAIRRAETFALLCTRPLRWFEAIFHLPLKVLSILSNAVLRVLGIAAVSELELAHSEEELRVILGASHEKGAFTLTRLLMLENVLDLGKLKVSDVMVPWARAVVLELGADWEKNLGRIREARFSRYPVVGPHGGVVGVVHIKDLFLAAPQGGPPDLARAVRPPIPVRPDLPCEELLRLFLNRQQHLAIVDGGDGKPAGIASLEQLLEELVGPIRDEHEQAREVALRTLIPPEAIVLDLEADSKEAAIRALVERLASLEPRVEAGAVVARILEREKVASTAIGDGIAIPHERIAGLPRPIAAIGRLARGIDFHAADRQPVGLVFLILTAVQDPGTHLLIVEKIATFLSSEYLRGRLLSAKDPPDVVEILRIADQSVIS